MRFFVGVLLPLGVLGTLGLWGVPPRAEAHLHFAARQRDVGPAAPGTVLEACFPWRRGGHGPLRVLPPRPDCGCAEVRGLPPTPTGTGTLVATVRVPSAPGPFHVRVRIYVRTAGRTQSHVLTVCGSSQAPLRVHPSRLDLGRRTPGRWVERRLEVRSAEPLERLSAHLVGLEGEVEVLPPWAHGRPGRGIRLAFEVPAAAAPPEAALTLRRVGGQTLRVPIRWSVVRRSRPTAPPGRDPPR